jgi:hypothetical protein
MISFKKYYEHVTLGIVEPIFIEEVGELDAKIDSGNEGYNVLGATNITKENDKVRFMANGNTLVKKIIEEGKELKDYIINYCEKIANNLNIKIRNIFYFIFFFNPLFISLTFSINKELVGCLLVLIFIEIQVVKNNYHFCYHIF